MKENNFYKIKCENCSFEKSEELPFYGEEFNNLYIIKCQQCKKNIIKQFRIEKNTNKILKELPLLPDITKIKTR
jgi:hypothetical protein